jgi:hypothetical protein
MNLDEVVGEIIEGCRSRVISQACGMSGSGSKSYLPREEEGVENNA